MQNYISIKRVAQTKSEGKEFNFPVEEIIQNAQQDFLDFREGLLLQKEDLEVSLKEAEAAKSCAEDQGKNCREVRELEQRIRQLTLEIRIEIRKAAQKGNVTLRELTTTRPTISYIPGSPEPVQYYEAVSFWTEKISNLDSLVVEEDLRIVELQNRLKYLKKADSSKINEIKRLKRELKAVNRKLEVLDEIGKAEEFDVE